MPIRQTIWLAIALSVASSVLGTSGVYGYKLYQRARSSEGLYAEAVAESYAAQVAPLLTESRRTQAVRFIEQVAWHPASRMLCLLDSNGSVIASRGNDTLLDDYRRLRPDRTQRRSWHVRDDSLDLTAGFSMAAIPVRTEGQPQPLGTLVYARSATHVNWLSRESPLQWVIYLLLIAATGMITGFAWLKRQVLDPLGQLSRASSAATGGEARLPIERADELGELARSLASMHVGIEEWRDKAARLERSIKTRVAAETERITRELKSAQKKIWTDPLTKLGNRRLWEEKFAEIFKAQRDTHNELSLVVLDVDNFKKLNDTLGHQAGDELLQFAGELLRQCLREQDLAIRYGGDEFILILPSVSPEQARAIAERTIAMFAQRTKTLALPIKPTLSAGIASLQQHHPATPEALLQMADSALYQAKYAGKSRTTIFGANMQPAMQR